MKRLPKSYYQYKIEWVHITPELRKQYLAPLGQRAYNEIGMSIRYTGEFLRQIFMWKPPEKNPAAVQKVNQKVWDAIVKYVEAKSKKEGNGIIEQVVVPVTKIKTMVIKDLTKPTNNVKNITEAKPKSNFTINTHPVFKPKPPMPSRKAGEDSLSFAQRKNEWKKKYSTK